MLMCSSCAHFRSHWEVAKNAIDRASQTTPSFLPISRSGIPKAGLGIWTEVPLSKGMVFGPYKGIIVKNRKEAQKSGYAWVIWKGGKAHHYVEGDKKDASSWLRFVNCAGEEEKQNLVAFQYKKKIYYKTYKPVLPFQELLVWYGGEYAADLGIDRSRNACIIPTEVDGFRCDLCPSLFSSRDVLERHRKHHRHTGPGRRHGCPHCDYSTDHPGHLQRHQLVHSGEKPHHCPHCHRGFARKNSLRRHERIHAGERPFSCGECGRDFTLKQHLERHERTHSGDRPFLCSTCGRGFSDGSILREHLRVHNRQKPYKCSHCDYRCTQSSTLTRHVIRRHTKRYPHACPHCQQGFVELFCLRKHLDRVHT